ncbi:TetR/AcrR family transcriptional regulator [Haloechinothrix sp. LS1_15]|uniref:TetR/AcrR family transcriptional regulator n=1 Tax=Haloechinothrix sp. LS1_15 TaxID=2652248 RepID=UPI00294AFE0A|nr:TetR/AcrR family transcriptional regulator [Haloechinothrix sp. LS1_15]
MEDEHAQRRRDGRVRDTRERIHTVALDLFISRGFAKTTMQDIADELGLTKAALYYHFPTKQALVRSVVQPAVDEVNHFLAQAREQGVPRRELLERFFDINYANRTVFLALTLDPSGLADVDLDNWIPHLAETFQQLLLGPDPTNDQRVRVVMIANGLSRVATLFTDIPYDELRAAAVNAALQTLDASPLPAAPDS